MAGVSPSKKRVLKRLYEDPQEPGSFSGVRALYRTARIIKPDITMRDVEKFMEGSRTYTLHKLQPKRFRRRAILCPKPRVIIAADLADMRELSRFNKGYSYILVMVDAFSRYAKALPLKRKDGKSMLGAVKSMLEEDDAFKGVSRMFVDRGKEFYNSTLQNYLQSKDIKLYSVFSQEIKSSIAERFIRTLKGRMYRYVTTRNSLEYISALQKIIKSYNNTPHRRLGKTPSEVHAMRDPQQIIEQFRRIHYKSRENPRRNVSQELKPGAYVRLVGAEKASKFSRGFHIQNTEEIFKVACVDHRQYPVGYTLQDLSGEPIQGLFYREELIKVQLPEFFPVIIKKIESDQG